MRRFDVLRVATGSYTVEKKRIDSRKLFKWVPGLQDAKNGPKLTENVKNRILPNFWPYFPYFSPYLGRRHGALARAISVGIPPMGYAGANSTPVFSFRGPSATSAPLARFATRGHKVITPHLVIMPSPILCPGGWILTSRRFPWGCAL